MALTTSERTKRWKLKNPERVKAYRKATQSKYYNPEKQREHRADNLEAHMLYGARSRAKRRGLEFDIDVTDINIPDKCPILGIKLSRRAADGVPRKGPSRESPTLDRIDNRLGYVKGNIQVISHKANTMKNDSTVDELLAFANWVKAVYEA